MAKWVHASPLPIFSVLVSRHGKLVFELYTSNIDRDAAHEQWSVTKSFVSALVGIAIDEKFIRDVDESVVDALPEGLFPSPADRDRFKAITVKELLGMSALNTPGTLLKHGHYESADLERHKKFFAADNRVRFALGSPLVDNPGTTFVYNAEGPAILSGIVSYATHETLFEYGQKHLFAPMEFKNHEWTSQDRSGIDYGGSGLRLRPIDMQKFGILYLQHGSWKGKPLVPKAWADESFVPYMRLSPKAKSPEYGWFWWQQRFKKWTGHVARGLRGQRIFVFPAQDVVVTMTADLDDEQENSMKSLLVDDYVAPSLEHGASGRSSEPPPALAAELAKTLQTAWHTNHSGYDPRNFPSVAHHAKHSAVVAPP
jgi:CubicO group peptidase (beta-lactamase class C family)